MPELIHIQDLKAEEITELLSANSHHFSADQANAAQASVRQITNVRKAYDVLEMLGKIDRAA